MQTHLTWTLAVVLYNKANWSSIWVGTLGPNLTFEEHVKQKSKAAMLNFTTYQGNKTQLQFHCLQHPSVNAMHLFPGLLKCITIWNQT